MQVPDGLCAISPERKKQIKERIRAEAERQRRTITTFSFAPGRNPMVTTGIIVILLAVGALLSSKTATVMKEKEKGRSFRMKAVDELFALRIGIERFRRDCGRYPTIGEGLKVLVRNPGEEKWKGPYVNLVKPDPWKKSYVYVVESNRVNIFSCGPDRRAGTADDIFAFDPEDDEVNDDLINPVEKTADEYVVTDALPPVRIGK